MKESRSSTAFHPSWPKLGGRSRNLTKIIVRSADIELNSYSDSGLEGVETPICVRPKISEMFSNISQRVLEVLNFMDCRL
jgi:hypothetical protein